MPSGLAQPPRARSRVRGNVFKSVVLKGLHLNQAVRELKEEKEDREEDNVYNGDKNNKDALAASPWMGVELHRPRSQDSGFHHGKARAHQQHHGLSGVDVQQQKQQTRYRQHDRYAYDSEDNTDVKSTGKPPVTPRLASGVQGVPTPSAKGKAQATKVSQPSDQNIEEQRTNPISRR